jgi:hypothetical protein
MKTESVKNLVKRARGELQWPVLEQPHELPVLRVISYPRTRSHVILVPDKKQQKRSTDLDCLHELGHATLCERVHPVFSASSHFASQESERHFLVAVPALNVACDWFVSQWQMMLSPQLSRKQIRKGLSVAEEVLGADQLPPLEIILDAAGVIAQNIHYLGEPIECEGVLQQAVDACLSIPPEQPSAENCQLLVNLLMATYTDYRVRLLHEDEIYTWEIYQPAPAAGEGGDPGLAT